jgi:hypothetical protein
MYSGVFSDPTVSSIRLGCSGSGPVDSGGIVARLPVPLFEFRASGQILYRGNAVSQAVLTRGSPRPRSATGAKRDRGSRAGRADTLFDGHSLGQWKVTDFGGQGDVYVKDGAIYLEMGSYATGITWTGPVIRMNYEITLEAMRVEGTTSSVR